MFDSRRPTDTQRTLNEVEIGNRELRDARAGIDIDGDAGWCAVHEDGVRAGIVAGLERHAFHTREAHVDWPRRARELADAEFVILGSAGALIIDRERIGGRAAHEVNEPADVIEI